MKFDILKALYHELISSTQLERTPESELIMDATDTVNSYSQSGDVGNALYGPYLYNALQVSARLNEGDLVIDLGCGSGRLLNLIARWNPNVSFIGVDLAPNMLNSAKTQAEKYNIKNVSYIQDDFSVLSKLKEKSADMVISSMALHHLPDRNTLTNCFNAIKKILKNNGKLYLMDFGLLRSKNTIEIFVSKISSSENKIVVNDYRESLHAAYKFSDFRVELKKLAHPSAILCKTILAPLIVIISTPLPEKKIRKDLWLKYKTEVNKLSPLRKKELKQLCIFLKLGGMRFPK